MFGGLHGLRQLEEIQTGLGLNMDKACMCKANDPDPDIREEYCDGAAMILYDFDGELWWYCNECGNYQPEN